MTRIKRGTVTRRRHNKMLKATKGFRGMRHRVFKYSKNAFLKIGQRAFVGRKLRKRDFRSLWIVRINAACRPLGISYSRLIEGLTKKGITINRKMLAELAVNEPGVFKAIVEAVK